MAIINNFPGGGSENLDAVLDEQNTLIEELKTALEGKSGIVAYVSNNILYLPQSSVSGNVLEV